MSERPQLLDLAERTRDWLGDTVRKLYPAQSEAFIHRLDEIVKPLRATSEVHVALVGTTGAGKSTFLNAILRQEVLPVGVMEPCTAFVTTVRHSDVPGFVLTTEFISAKEWERDVDCLASTLELKEGDDDQIEIGRQEQRVARARLETVFGRAQLDAALAAKQDIRQLPLPPEVAAALSGSGRRRESFATDLEMLAAVEQLIRGESTLWPLVKRVDVVGNYPQVPKGVVLVDLPGLNDPNAARVEVTREYLRSAPYVWVVFNMVRGMTKDIHSVLIDEKVLRDLLMYGNYHSLALIGTQADQIQPGMGRRLGLPAGSSDSVLVNTYREQSVLKARQNLANMVRDFAPSGLEEAAVASLVERAEQVPIHMVSSVAYCKLTGVGEFRSELQLEPTDTGIPGVVAHLQGIGSASADDYQDKVARERLEGLRREILDFFRAQGMSVEDLARIRSYVATSDAAYRKDVAQNQQRAQDQLAIYRTNFSQNMDIHLVTAKQGLSEVFTQWRYLHWATLKATASRGGIFVSSSGRNNNMGEDMIAPLMRVLPVIWDKFFRDMRAVVNGLLKHVEVRSETHGGEVVRILQDILKAERASFYDEQVRNFKQKIATTSEESMRLLENMMVDRRRQMADRLATIARTELQPALERARYESGRGMKQRMLQTIEYHARSVVDRTYATIQAGLIEGLKELEINIVKHLEDIRKEAEKQADIFANNCSVDTDEAANNPQLAQLIKSLPQ